LPIVHGSAQGSSRLSHAEWLGTSQHHDADLCKELLQSLKPDWLICDHYALDKVWEDKLRPYCRNLMVIDDLADRSHTCDILLDQNLGRKKSEYTFLTPDNCTLLIGPTYALLRPEFIKLRDYSLSRRIKPSLRELLITMGGIDQPNATSQVLEALKECNLPADCSVTAVMGSSAPWLKQVEMKVNELPWKARVLVDINNMAQEMANSDLIIGAAGSTAWERCCLGVPSLVLTLANNQASIAEALCHNGSAISIGSEINDDLNRKIVNSIRNIQNSREILISMSEASLSITKGNGVNKIISWLYKK